MDCSLLGSSVHGIFQAKILEWLPPPGYGPNLGVEPMSLMSPALKVDSLPAEPQGKLCKTLTIGKTKRGADKNALLSLQLFWKSKIIPK